MKRYFWYLIQIFMIYAVCVTVILIVNPYTQWKAYFLMWLLTLEIWMCMWLFLNALRRRFDKAEMNTQSMFWITRSDKMMLLYLLLEKYNGQSNIYSCWLNLRDDQITIVDGSNIMELDDAEQRSFIVMFKSIPGININGDTITININPDTKQIRIENRLGQILAMSK